MKWVVDIPELCPTQCFSNPRWTGMWSASATTMRRRKYSDQNSLSQTCTNAQVHQKTWRSSSTTQLPLPPHLHPMVSLFQEMWAQSIRSDITRLGNRCFWTHNLSRQKICTMIQYLMIYLLRAARSKLHWINYKHSLAAGFEFYDQDKSHRLHKGLWRWNFSLCTVFVLRILPAFRGKCFNCIRAMRAGSPAFEISYSSISQWKIIEAIWVHLHCLLFLLPSSGNVKRVIDYISTM